MKAPEKVYVHPGAHLGMLTLTTIHVDAPGEEVYIRKDALMEILQGYSHPLTKLVMQEIIDKIKEL